MANSRGFVSGASSGERLTVTKINTIDLGQYYAVVRNGDTPLLANSTLTLDTYDFTIVAASSGLFKCPADKLSLTGTSWPVLASRTITDYAPAVQAVAAEADWKRKITGAWPNSIAYWECQNVVAAAPIGLLLGALPIGMTVTSCKAVVLGNSTGAPGGTMPAISFGYTTPAAPTTWVAVGDFTDTNTTEGPFETIHNIEKTGLSHVIAGGRQYQLNVLNGYGGNHLAGLALYGVYLTGTLTTLRTA